MSPPPTSTGSAPGGSTYEIRIAGHLESRWAAWFDGLTLTHESDGTTLIAGPVVDQAALHGLLHKIRDLGLPLISVTPVGAGHPDLPPPLLDEDSHFLKEPT